MWHDCSQQMIAVLTAVIILKLTGTQNENGNGRALLPVLWPTNEKISYRTGDEYRFCDAVKHRSNLSFGNVARFKDLRRQSHLR